MAFFLSLATMFITTQALAIGGGAPQKIYKGPGPQTAVSHNMSFDTSTDNASITMGTKTNGTYTDKIFKDRLGREAYFRGWNVSGAVKLKSMGFKPFLSKEDAAESFGKLRKKTGANMIRFTVAWEGINPRKGYIDTGYLDAVIAQMKEAIKQKLYILLDFHQDLFSRHLFNRDSWYQGNGVPEWALQKCFPAWERNGSCTGVLFTVTANYPREYCGVICPHWGQNLLTNEAIRKGYRDFWENEDIGGIGMQDAFIWQMKETLAYIKPRLTAAEFDYILGVDPANEPVDGGMEGLTPAQWDNQRLWPFYRKVRQVMNETTVGWGAKWVYAEPLVYWNANAVGVSRTGGSYVSPLPGEGFVFNAHFYDGGRMGLNPLPILNGTYIKDIEDIRKEGRFMRIPVFMSEFGMWVPYNSDLIDVQGSKDPIKMIKGVYQGMEQGNNGRVNKYRHPDFYAPLVSGTQWHWDLYYDSHAEYQNDNPAKLLTKMDAWNKENFSVIRDRGDNYTIHQDIVERAYPRRVQGEIMHFFYNDLAVDTWNNAVQLAAIQTTPRNENLFSQSPVYLENRRFLILTWKGRNSTAPTEIYIPASFNLPTTKIITEAVVLNGVTRSTTPANKSNEVLVMADGDYSNGVYTPIGNRVLIWDDVNPGELYHYALIMDDSSLSRQDLNKLWEELNYTILQKLQNPVYLRGSLDSSFPAQTKTPTIGIGR